MPVVGSCVGSCVGVDKALEFRLLDLDGSCEMLGVDDGFKDGFRDESCEMLTVDDGFKDSFSEGFDDGSTENKDDWALDVEGDVVEQLSPNGTDEYLSGKSIACKFSTIMLSLKNT